MTDFTVHTITDQKLLADIARLIGIGDVVDAIDQSPQRSIAGMALASAIANRALAERKVVVYQKCMREIGRAGINCAQITVLRIAGANTLEYSLSDLVDDMEREPAPAKS